MLKDINKNIKILYVEDDEVTRENAIEYLENYFSNIYEACDAIEALKIYEKIKPDIVITDIQMPKLNGLEFVKQIRSKDQKTQVIVITAFSNKEYLFKAIELQLVKYLIKPIKEKELEEALYTCINNIKSDNSNIFSLGDNIYFDLYNHNLFKDDEFIKLRTKELLLLELLLKNLNRYVTYTEIENYVWFDSDIGMSKDALKTVIKNLKAKLPKDLISNLSGTGYKIGL
jgi:DNA-binding response OmpR family regulator